MAQRTTKKDAPSDAAKNVQRAPRTRKSKAQEAVSPTVEERRAQQRDRLVARLVMALLLVFVTLFVLLTLFRVDAVVLNGIKKLGMGILGYGYWTLLVVCPFAAWLLAFIHRDPIKGRLVALGFVPILLSALLHTFRYIEPVPMAGEIAPGPVKALWQSGILGHSGGVIPGGLSQILQKLISKGGTVPVLLVLLVVTGIVLFHVSVPGLIHRRAEKRREKHPEPEEIEEPVAPVYDTRADLQTLARPVVRPISAHRAQKAIPQPQQLPQRDSRSFDVELGAKKPAKPQQLTFDDIPAEQEEPDIFTRRSKKKKKQEQGTQRNAFDIALGKKNPTVLQEEDWVVLDGEEEPYEAPQNVGADVPEEDPWEPENVEALLDEPMAAKPRKKPVAPEISEKALEIMKEQKISHGEAALAAAEVAMEIEAKSDEEAAEKPAYTYPPMTMLTEAMPARENNTEEMRTNVRRLEETLQSYGVDIQISNVVRGPAVTRYEMELKPGVRMNKITSLHEDIALSLGVSGVHVAAVPGKSSTIGIEVPNSIVTSVPLREVLESKEFKNHKSALAFAAGKDISGNYIIGDISKMPHLLIAGTTGSGKSVCMNSIIMSILYRDTPEQCRMIMIDPKVVELSIYNGIPHLLIPVVTEPKKAAGALQWAVTEMDRRYKRFEDARVRDLAGYNKKAAQDPELETMPRIIVIIDELADLMMVAAKEVETSIARLAAKARAAGMHLVIATQRPSADVITGVIKANIPSRIAFAVSSALESNIIMGSKGAEKLLGKGDMFYAPQGAKPTRVQGCFVSDEEVERVAELVRGQNVEAEYSDEIIKEIEQNATASDKPEKSGDTAPIDTEGDELLPEAVEVLLDTKQASVSMLQRRLKLGYAHAARIMDELEEKGIVGPFEGSKPRKMLVTEEQWATMVGLNPKAVAAEAPAAEEPEAEDVPFDEEDEV